MARRTLFGHFPNRQTLIAALAEEAQQSVEEAFTTARQPDADPATALARMTLAVCAVGDRCRVLIALARRDLGRTCSSEAGTTSPRRSSRTPC